MRYILILMLGILCFMMTGCPKEEVDDSPAISDGENRKADYTDDAEVADDAVVEEAAAEVTDEAAVEPCGECGMAPCECENAMGDDEAVACETCGNAPCTCEAPEEAHGEDDGHGH